LPRTQLLVEDVARTAEYYRDALGFRIKFLAGDPPAYGTVLRGEATVHLLPLDAGDRVRPNRFARNGATDVYIAVSDVDTLCEELRSHGATIVQQPETYAYGMREFTVEDCNGYWLCFGQEASGSGV
jgi:uncharacterized glyoxalase superfamily protein PhnB